MMQPIQTAQGRPFTRAQLFNVEAAIDANHRWQRDEDKRRKRMQGRTPRDVLKRLVEEETTLIIDIDAGALSIEDDPRIKGVLKLASRQVTKERWPPCFWCGKPCDRKFYGVHVCNRAACQDILQRWHFDHCNGKNAEGTWV